MSEINGIAKEIVKTIREDKNKGTKPYDTQATVMRVEDGTAWVRIPGGVDETPAQLTMDAKEGDSVQVRVSGGRAWLAGNGTSPPTDDTKAVEANETAKSASIAAKAAFNAADAAQTDAARAHDAADKAETSASEAKTQATAATSYANGALNSLSTTQDIVGVLSWVEESIKYVWDYPPTVEDKEYDPSKQYYTVIGKRVIDPIETDYDKYYILDSESEPASKTGNIVTFDSDLDNFPLKSLTATINPKQSGSGDPSPDNVRPISGWDSVRTYVSPTTSAEDGTTYTTDLPETVYGGSLDVVNGVLTVDRAMVDLGTLNWAYRASPGIFQASLNFNYATDNAIESISSVYPFRRVATSGSQANVDGTFSLYTGNTLLWICDKAYTDASAFKASLSGQKSVIPLATPQTHQLTPTQINTLLGENNVWADAGNVTVEYWDGPVGYVTPTSSFDPTETYYTVKGSPVKIDESKQEEHGKGLYYVHDLTNAKEAMADFIKARLALTDKGLYVVGGDTENEGYKILLASDGMTVYDAQGVAVSKFGENIEFSSTRPQYIGGETAYIVFNPEDGTINAGGEGFRFNNNMTLSDMLAEIGKIGGEDGLEQSTEDLLQKTKSISYENGKLIISGGENSNMKLVMESDRIGFYDGENEVAYISNNQMCIPRSIVLDSLDMGDNKWRWTLNTDDHLTLQWIGG